MLKRWYFDVAIGKCTDFVYGGWQGNINNFETEGECENICNGNGPAESRSKSNDLVCKLLLDQVAYREFPKRWSFDLSNGHWVEFICGGCKGNANNFESKEDCEERRILSKGLTQYSLQYPMVVNYFHERIHLRIGIHLCVTCHMNEVTVEPRFSTEASMHSMEDVSNSSIVDEQETITTLRHEINTPTDVNHSADSDCRLCMEVGPCKVTLQRWYYDTSSAQCLELYYGGCRGNANQFQSKRACEAKCTTFSLSEVVSNATSICYLLHESKSCEADIRRGCGGNTNNFRTKTECERRCLAKILVGEPAHVNDALDPICRLPQEVGPCRAYMTRWSYDASKTQCVEFSYGGRRGNANNFKTKEACEIKCGVNICKLPKEEGPCRGKNPRFYYNSASEQCLEFNYGGCRGNANNFLTKAECKARCIEAP
nr:Papilin [Hymenolepis microstoma]